MEGDGEGDIGEGSVGQEPEGDIGQARNLTSVSMGAARRGRGGCRSGRASSARWCRTRNGSADACGVEGRRRGAESGDGAGVAAPDAGERHGRLRPRCNGRIEVAGGRSRERLPPRRPTMATTRSLRHRLWQATMSQWQHGMTPVVDQREIGRELERHPLLLAFSREVPSVSHRGLTKHCHNSHGRLGRTYGREEIAQKWQ